MTITSSKGEGGDLPPTRRSVIAFATAAAVNSSPLPLPRRHCCYPTVAVVSLSLLSSTHHRLRFAPAASTVLMVGWLHMRWGLGRRSGHLM